MADLTESVERYVSARPLRPAWPGVAEALRPRDMVEGYRVQRAVHERLVAEGARLDGYKIGSTSAAGQAVFGLTEPVYAGIFRETRAESMGEALMRPLAAPAVECEIAVVMGNAVDASASEAELRAAVASCHLACEIIDQRYGEPPTEPPEALLPDDFFHIGYVLGPANPRWRDLDLPRLEARVEIDGAVHEGVATDVLSAFDALGWLARKLAEADLALKPGDVVLTGSIVPPKPIAAPPASLTLAIDGFKPMRLDGR